MDIYLKQKEKITMTDKTSVTVEDLCDIVAEDNKVKKIVVLVLPKGQYKRYVVTSIDITKKILDYNKDLKVNIGGITDTIVEYKQEPKQTIFEKIKVLLVSIVVFSGASTTIMSFHNETAIPEVFDQYYKIFFGVESHNAMIIDIPYSLGLAISIILFFNHVFGKKLTDSPTPIEVEIVKYESDLAKAEAKMEEHQMRQENKTE